MVLKVESKLFVIGASGKKEWLEVLGGVEGLAAALGYIESIQFNCFDPTTRTYPHGPP